VGVLLVVAGLVLGGMWALRAAQDDAGQEATGDPCGLLTRDEVARYVGKDAKLGAGRPAPPGSVPPVRMTGMRWCKYPQGAEGSVRIGATTPGTDATFATKVFKEWLCHDQRGGLASCEDWQQQLREAQAQDATLGRSLAPVSDLGVAAVWQPNALVVLTQRQVLAFEVRRCDNRFDVDAGEQQRATLMAETVLARNARRMVNEQPADEQPEGTRAGEVPDLAPECKASTATPDESSDEAATDEPAQDEADNDASQPDQGEAEQDQAEQGEAQQGEAEQDQAGQGQAEQDQADQGQAGQGEAEQGQAEQNENDGAQS
jgi:hypothetical protein